MIKKKKMRCTPLKVNMPFFSHPFFSSFFFFTLFSVFLNPKSCLCTLILSPWRETAVNLNPVRDHLPRAKPGGGGPNPAANTLQTSLRFLTPFTILWCCLGIYTVYYRKHLLTYKLPMWTQCFLPNPGTTLPSASLVFFCIHVCVPFPITVFSR